LVNFNSIHEALLLPLGNYYFKTPTSFILAFVRTSSFRKLASLLFEIKIQIECDRIIEFTEDACFISEIWSEVEYCKIQNELNHRLPPTQQKDNYMKVGNILW